MVKFKYVARNADGKQEMGSLEASSSDDAVNALQKQGLLILSIAEAHEEPAALIPKGRGKKVKGRRGKVGAEDLVFFARQFSAMIGAGIPLVRALQILQGQVTSTSLSIITDELIRDVEGGKTLAAAFGRHPKVFSGFWINLVETGEAAGQLTPVLGQIADYLEARAALQKKIVSALIYPAILLCVAAVAIIVFTVFVIPVFSNIFNSFGAQLPALTQAVLNLSFVIRHYGLFFLAGGVLLGFGAKSLLSTRQGRLAWDKFYSRLPVLGDLFRNSASEEFARGLGILVRSGIPILQALEIVSRTSSSPLIVDMLLQIQKEVRQGRPIGESLERHSIFPPFVAQIISVGEETGELGGMLDRLAGFCKDRVDTTVTRVTTLFEPVLLVLMAGVIGTLIISMYLPIFKLGSTLK